MSDPKGPRTPAAPEREASGPDASGGALRPAIEDVLIAYAASFDSADLDGVADTFTEDATVDLGSGPIHGRGALREAMAVLLARFATTRHMVTNVRVAETASARVHASSLVHAFVVDRDGGGQGLVMDYADVLRWDEDAWRIEERSVAVTLTYPAALRDPGAEPGGTGS